MTVTHGTLTGYVKGKCRCDECVRAHHGWDADRRARLRATPFEQVPHGLNGYINYSCRCDVCTTAKSQQKRSAPKTSRQPAPRAPRPSLADDWAKAARTETGIRRSIAGWAAQYARIAASR